MALGRIDRFFYRMGRVAENYPRATKAVKITAPVVTAGIAAAFDLWASFGIARDTLLISAPSAAAVTSGVGALFSWGTKQVVTRVKSEEEKMAARAEATEKEKQLAAAQSQVSELEGIKRTLEEAGSKIAKLTMQNMGMQQSLRAVGLLAVDDVIPFADGNYIYKGKLGEGGMAAVVKVYAKNMEEDRVFKMPLPGLLADEVEIKRFRDAEAISMKDIVCPGIVRFWNRGAMSRKVYEAMMGPILGDAKGVPEQIPYIEMEFVDAPTLDRVVWKEKKFSIGRAISIAIDIARTMRVVKEYEIVHRDLKTANVFLLAGDKTKVGDFGLAKKGQISNMTRGVMGSPENMSPEQWYGNADWRSDQYALGIILCEMASGQPPFGRSGNAMEQVLAYRDKALKEELPKQEIMGRIGMNEESVERFWQVMSRMLARKPENRYQSWDACIKDLEDLTKTQDGPPVTSKTMFGPFTKGDK
jgi:hypothetical protein